MDEKARIEFQCNQRITDRIVCELFSIALRHHEIAVGSNGVPLCESTGFVFMYRFGGFSIPVQIQRHDDKLVYIARIKKLDSFESPEYFEFLNQSTSNLDSGFIASGNVTPDGVHYAIARYDSPELTDENPRALSMEFVTAKANLSLFLNGLNPSFLQPKSIGRGNESSRGSRTNLWGNTTSLPE
ncbi:MAG: hypothetical protein L6Q98_14315 [Anaerolineae bacterium]|nr:hypothetical protein [Anaerolineae bacterium]NUQ04810.1 hypothetical protein [Anaerolineae bacterium]